MPPAEPDDIWRPLVSLQVSARPPTFYGYIGKPGQKTRRCHDRRWPGDIRNGAGDPNGCHFSVEAANRCAARAARQRNLPEVL